MSWREKPRGGWRVVLAMVTHTKRVANLVRLPKGSSLLFLVIIIIIIITLLLLLLILLIPLLRVIISENG